MLHARCVSSLLLVTLSVSGCTTAYVPPPLPLSHPANPDASEAPPLPLSQAFTSAHLSPASSEEMPARPTHAGHSAMHGGHQ